MSISSDIRLSERVEAAIRDIPDPQIRRQKLALLEACFDQVNIGTPAHPERWLRGVVRDVYTLRALAAQLEIDDE